MSSFFKLLLRIPLGLYIVLQLLLRVLILQGKAFYCLKKNKTEKQDKNMKNAKNAKKKKKNQKTETGIEIEPENQLKIYIKMRSFTFAFNNILLL